MRAIIALYIILGIIALIVILLHFSIRAYVKVDGDGFELKVKYLFFTVFRLPADPNKKKKPKKDKKKKLKKNEKTKHIEAHDTPLSEAEIDELSKQLEEEENTTEETVTEIVEEIKEPAKPLTKAEIKAEKKRLKEEKKKEKAEKKRLKAEEKANKPSMKEKLDDLKQKWLKVKPYIPYGWKAVKKLLKTIRFRNTDIKLGFGKEDPYEAAMNYGKMNIAVYDALAVLGNIFTMHYKQVKVICLFNEKATKYDVKTCVCVRPSTVIAIAFCTLINFLKVFLRERRKAKKKAKELKKANEIKIKETECLENE